MRNCGSALCRFLQLLRSKTESCCASLMCITVGHPHAAHAIAVHAGFPDTIFNENQKHGPDGTDYLSGTSRRISLLSVCCNCPPPRI